MQNPTLEAYIDQAVNGALHATGTDPELVDRAWIGNFVGELFANQGHLGAAVVGANPGLLYKPVMRVEVVVPEEFVGAVQGDLNSRRGNINGFESRGNLQVIAAEVPLASMFGYVNNLRSMTQGRATYAMQFSHYEQVPARVSEGIVYN